ncbi:hypothetical protein Scep_012292 [Stephania cephalantha]|uniref:Uncharacterized protein n=1 Tax=Stephania cephalantha TaxID=152367 RepID=A0AAP0JEU4_9MAGN
MARSPAGERRSRGGGDRAKQAAGSWQRWARWYGVRWRAAIGNRASAAARRTRLSDAVVSNARRKRQAQREKGRIGDKRDARARAATRRRNAVRRLEGRRHGAAARSVMVGRRWLSSARGAARRAIARRDDAVNGAVARYRSVGCAVSTKSRRRDGAIVELLSIEWVNWQVSHGYCYLRYESVRAGRQGPRPKPEVLHGRP